MSTLSLEDLGSSTRQRLGLAVDCSICGCGRPAQTAALSELVQPELRFHPRTDIDHGRIRVMADPEHGIRAQRLD